MSAKLSILSDTEKMVVQTTIMRLHTEEALEYLRDNGINMARRSYFRHKKKIEGRVWARLRHNANLFTYQHLERMDKLDLIEELMWKNYFLEKSPYKRVKILESIASVQQYISSYYDATTFVFQGRMKTDILAQQQEQFTAAEQSAIKSTTPFSGYDFNNGNGETKRV